MRRNLVAFGSTRARADRASSIRDLEFGMPRVSLPDIEPDASNTTIASSRQGGIVFSSARDVALQARSTAKAMGVSLTIRSAANSMARDSQPIARCPDEVANLSKRGGVP